MSNTDLDKGAALEILRYTAKTAAAPAVGIGGPPAQEPGPLVPGGGGALGGSNNAQMQTGWAAGAMRKSLIKKFTANAAKQQGQSVNVAASKQVGGMGSGMPKMAAIGARLEKQAGLGKLVLKGIKGIKEGVPGARKLFEKYRKYRTKGLDEGLRRFADLPPSGSLKKINLTKTRTPVNPPATTPTPSLRERAVKQYQKASAPKPPEDPAKVVVDSIEDMVRSGDTTIPDKAVKAGADALRQTLPPPEGFKSYIEPGKRHILNPKRMIERGRGFDNIYEHKETGKLIRGAKGTDKGRIRNYIGKGRGPMRTIPAGYKVAKGGHFTSTGGAIPSGVKKSLYRGAGFYGVGLGAGNLLNPKSSMFDSKRQRLAVGMAALPSLATVPGAGLAATSDGYKNLMLKGYSSGVGLGRSEGGAFAGKALSPLEVGEEIQRRRIKRLDKDRVALIQKEIKEGGGRLSQEAIQRLYDFDKKVGYINSGPMPMKSAPNVFFNYSAPGRRRDIRNFIGGGGGAIQGRGGNIMDFKAKALPGEPGYRRPSRGVRREESLRKMLRHPLGEAQSKKPGATLQRHLRRDIYRTADPRAAGLGY